MLENIATRDWEAAYRGSSTYAVTAEQYDRMCDYYQNLIDEKDQIIVDLVERLKNEAPSP